MNKKLNAIFLGFVILSSDAAYAVEKKNIDVALVMDSTGSMKKTDPLSLRIPAAKLFISLLDSKDRTGVVSFSDEASTLVPLTVLDSGENKNALLNAADRITSAGFHTNLYEAVNKGFEILSSDKKAGRDQIIVLMSDGLMDTGDPEKDRTLAEKLQTDLTKALVDSGIKVYAIAFTGQSDRQLLEKISKQTGGFFNLAMTDKDFHVVFTSIFEGLKTPDMLPMTQNGFLVDKSIEEVTIVATKETAGTVIQLRSPEGKEYSSKNRPPDGEWFVSNNFDMATIKKPAGGKWEILFSAGKNNKAYVITNLNLQTNFNELYPLFGETLDIKVWLEREGKPLQEKEVLEKIDIYLELTKPDGETMKLSPFDQGSGVFQRKIELFTAGSYKLRIVADGKTFQREKAFVFKASDVKESQEEMKIRQSLKKTEKTAEQEPLKKDHDDKVNWVKVIIQFAVINLVVCAVVIAYLKRKYFMDLAQSIIKRKKEK